MPRSIRARVLLGSVIAILVALAVVAVAVPGIATQHEIDVLGARLASEAALAGDLSRDQFVRADADALDLLAKRIASDASVRVTFVATDGTVMGESDDDRRTMENHATRPEIVPALAGSEGRAIRHSATVDRDLLYVAVPVRAGDRIVGVSRLALPLVAVDALAGRLSLSLLAAAVDPSVLLMDEPCSALDPIATYKIEELVRELSREVTIVIVTHNMQQASRVSERTAFMLAADDGIGRLVEFGKTDDLFTMPRDPRTEAYITGRFG